MKDLTLKEGVKIQVKGISGKRSEPKKVGGGGLKPPPPAGSIVHVKSPGELPGAGASGTSGSGVRRLSGNSSSFLEGEVNFSESTHGTTESVSNSNADKDEDWGDFA